MAELVAPTTLVHRSYLDAVSEYGELLRNSPAQADREHSYLQNRFADGDAQWLADPENFAVFVERIKADALPDSPRPQGWCPATHLWLVEGDLYIGALDIRHELTPFLLETGGTIGYDVRPSARGRGLGKQMLALALPVARSLGFDPVLVTCDVPNTASRRVIEANGGVFEDERNGKLRFWVPTS